MITHVLSRLRPRRTTADPAVSPGCEDDGGPATSADADDASRERRALRQAFVATMAAACALGGVLGYLSWQEHRADQVATQREQFLQVARQAAINLTTISYTEVDADVARILDSATGSFHDDFKERAPQFVDVVRKAQSVTQGTITEAGLESVDGDTAQVVLAVSVKTSNTGAQDQQPRGWRMRLDVQKTGDAVKVSDVQFVP